MLKYATNMYLYRKKKIDNVELREVETGRGVNAFFLLYFDFWAISIFFLLKDKIDTKNKIICWLSITHRNLGNYLHSHFMSEKWEWRYFIFSLCAQCFSHIPFPQVTSGFPPSVFGLALFTLVRCTSLPLAFWMSFKI